MNQQSRWIRGVGIAAIACAAAVLVPVGSATAKPNCDVEDPPPICLPKESVPDRAHAVVGHIDSIGPVDGGLRVTGWVLDPDTTASLTVGLTVDGHPAISAAASLARPDVAAAYPGKGSAHGFDLVLPRPANGRRAVCLTAVGVKPGSTTADVVDCAAWTELRNPPDASEQLTLLAANMQGTESEVVDWRLRYQRMATWMSKARTVPDLLILQEVPASKCWIAGGCSPHDYESLFGLIRGIHDQVGVTYRIAHLSVGPSVEGWNPLFQGRAVLYNPARLRNSLIASNAQAAFDSPLDQNPQARQSYPCLRPPAAWVSDCGLLDRGAGVHYAVSRTSFGRFELVEHPGLSIDVYDMHARTPEPGPDYSVLVQRLIPAVPPAGTRLYPPIVAGDFNARIGDINNEVAAGGRLEPFTIGAFVQPPDVMGVLLGEQAAYPAVRQATVADARVLPDATSGPEAPCGPEEPKWSDHCAVFVRLAPQ